MSNVRSALLVTLGLSLASVAGVVSAAGSTNADGGEGWKHHIVGNVAFRAFDRHEDSDDLNPGLGYEGVKGNWRVMTGFYHNAEADVRGYLLGAYTPARFQPTAGSQIAAGAFFGVLANYNVFDDDRLLRNTAGLMLSWEPVASGVGVNVLVEPKMSGVDLDGYTAVQLKYAF